MANTLTDYIHDAILARLRDTNFPVVTFDADGKRTTSAVDTVRAKSFKVQPVQTTFKRGRNMRTFALDRDSYDWLANLRFSSPVDLTAFEDALMESPIKISRDVSGSDHQVLVELRDTVYEIPTTGQPASGTWVSLRLTATLSPK